MRHHQGDGARFVTGLDGFQERKVLLHGRHDAHGARQRTVDADQLDVQVVDPIDVREDLVAHRIDHAVVQAPVHGDRVLVQRGVVRRLPGTFQDGAVLRRDLGKLFVAHVAHVLRHRLALDHGARLECVADQLEIHRGDLQATLGHRGDEAGRLQPRDHLAHRAQRHAEQQRQLLLGNELPRLQARGQHLLPEALVGLVAQMVRGGRSHGIIITSVKHVRQMFDGGQGFRGAKPRVCMLASPEQPRARVSAHGRTHARRGRRTPKTRARQRAHTLPGPCVLATPDQSRSSGGRVPPLAAMRVITCLCSHRFHSAEPGSALPV